MKVRIKFSADIVIEADTMKEIREKWNVLPLFSGEALEEGIEFCETLLIEDAELYVDVTNEFNNA